LAVSYLLGPPEWIPVSRLLIKLFLGGNYVLLSAVMAIIRDEEANQTVKMLGVLTEDKAIAPCLGQIGALRGLKNWLHWWFSDFGEIF